MDPVYEGTINRKRLHVPCCLDDVMFALRLESGCVATYRRTPISHLALRHRDVFEAEVAESLKYFDESDVFANSRFLCSETQDVKRDGRHLYFHDLSLKDFFVGNESPVCLDVFGENLIIVKKDDWPKYVELRSVNSK